MRATPLNNRLLPALADARSGVSGRVSLGGGEVYAVSEVADPVEVIAAGSGAFVRYVPASREVRMSRSLVLVVALSWAVGSACAQDADGVRWPPQDSAMVHTVGILRDANLRQRVPACRAAGAVATGDSIGAVAAGQTLNEVLETCSEGLAVWDWGSEAIPEPALLQRFGDDLVLAILEDTVGSAEVYRVASVDAQTPEGIGSGSTFAEVVAAYGVLRLVTAECALWVTTERMPGLSFPVRLPAESEIDCIDLASIVAENAVAEVPENAVVIYLNQYGY